MSTLYPVATDLSHGDKLPSSDEVARYCKPSEYDLGADTPLVGAFLRRPGEADLSVNRLQFFQGASRSSAVGCIRGEVGGHYKLKSNGRFVVLNVGDVQSAAKQKGFDVNIIYTPKSFRPSHSSIVDLPPTRKEELEIATAFFRLVSPTDIYHAVL
jgi:hypothetical protein